MTVFAELAGGLAGSVRVCAAVEPVKTVSSPGSSVAVAVRAVTFIGLSTGWLPGVMPNGAMKNCGENVLVRLLPLLCT